MRFWEQLKKIFSNSKPVKFTGVKQVEPEEKLVVHEIISRTETELKYYEQWSQSSAKCNFLEWLNSQYHSYKTFGKCDNALTFLMIPSMNGFAVRFDDSRWHAQDFLAIFDFLKHIFSTQENYWLQVSDSKTISKGKNIEIIERHYLKPPMQFINQGEKKNQKFGNLMITLNTINGRVDTLKLSATQYNDHLFEKAYDFDLLMELLSEIK
jgi:hypothetical protein